MNSDMEFAHQLLTEVLRHLQALFLATPDGQNALVSGITRLRHGKIGFIHGFLARMLKGLAAYPRHVRKREERGARSRSGDGVGSSGVYGFDTRGSDMRESGAHDFDTHDSGAHDSEAHGFDTHDFKGYGSQKYDSDTYYNETNGPDPQDFDPHDFDAWSVECRVDDERDEYGVELTYDQLLAQLIRTREALKWEVRERMRDAQDAELCERVLRDDIEYWKDIVKFWKLRLDRGGF